MSQLLGWRADCLERFERGETVRILCKAGDSFLYAIKARKNGVAKGPVR